VKGQSKMQRGAGKEGKLDSEGQLGIEWLIPPSAEKDPKRVEWALRERIKELNCLYAIAQLAERCGNSLDQLLAGVVRIIPPSWQYPEVTCARITFKDTTYRTDTFKATRWKQAAAIQMYDQSVGKVEVFYTKEQVASFEGPFLREERALVDTIAEQIGHIAMRLTAERELQETNSQLTIERKALQETNAALRTVLARIEEEKGEIYRDIHANVDKVLMPILHALAFDVTKKQRKYVELLRDNLEQIASPFVSRLSERFHSLTPTEISICNMVRNGMRTKEVAELRGVSAATISRHREHIRSKLGIANQKVNLITHLQASGILGKAGMEVAQ